MPYSVEPVGLVVPDVSVVGNGVERVPVLVHLEVEDQAARRRDELALILDADLALGKDGELAVELLLGPRLHARKAALLERDDALPVLRTERPHDEVLFELLQVDWTRHRRQAPSHPRSFVDLQVVVRHSARVEPPIERLAARRPAEAIEPAHGVERHRQSCRRCSR